MMLVSWSPRRLALSVAIGLIALPASGCIDKSEIRDVERHVTRFRSMLKSERYEQIYDTSSREMQEARPKEELVSFLKSLDRNMGQFRSAERRGLSKNHLPKGLYFVATYESQYERGKAIETFNFVKEDGLKLVGYNIETKVVFEDRRPDETL